MKRREKEFSHRLPYLVVTFLGMSLGVVHRFWTYPEDFNVNQAILIEFIQAPGKEEFRWGLDAVDSILQEGFVPDTSREQQLLWIAELVFRRLQRAMTQGTVTGIDDK